MLVSAAHALRPVIRPVRQENPSVLRTTLIVVGAAAAGTLLYRWIANDARAPATKRRWVYWAKQDAEGRWQPRVESPDGSRPNAGASYDTREEAEEAARMFVEMNGGIPLLSDTAPGNEDVASGLEGAPIPKKNYVGTGWFWPNQDLFPTEDSILQFLASLGYVGSGNGVQSGPNMDMIKRWQSDYNLVARFLQTGTQWDNAWPVGLSVDGLLGPMSMQALAVMKLGLNDEDQAAAWHQAVKDGKAFAAIPVAVKQILRLGYGAFSKWMQTNTAGRKAMIRPFQDDYNCVFKNTDNPKLVVDGKVGTQTKQAAANATAIVDSFDTSWDQFVAAC